jgi:hypothetical protein
MPMCDLSGVVITGHRRSDDSRLLNFSPDLLYCFSSAEPWFHVVQKLVMT